MLNDILSFGVHIAANANLALKLAVLDHLSFPVLQPPNIFHLIAGQTVDLIAMALPQMVIEVQFHYAVGLLPAAQAHWGSHFSVQLVAEIGYDSYSSILKISTKTPKQLLAGFVLSASEPFLAGPGASNLAGEVGIVNCACVKRWCGRSLWA